MYKILFSIIIVILIIFSMFTGATAPSMHNVVQIYDSKYVITNNPPQDNQGKTEKIKEETVIPTIENKVVKKEEKVVVKTPEVSKKTVKNEQIKTEKKVENKKVEEKKPTVKVEEKVKHVVQEAPKTVKQEVKSKEEIEREEIIAWNVWRSNLQNKLMQDVRMPYMPDGIVFKFSFTVDKYGKITNINTYSTNPRFTPYAVEYIAPVIRSYQGKSILEFPKNSNRTSTEFEGHWKISNKTTYSNPSDYNDYEKVKK